MVTVQPDVIGCFTQALLYGVYFISSSYCLRCLLFDKEGRKLRPKIHWPMTIVTVVLLILITATVVAAFRLMLIALEGGSGSSAYITTFVVASGLGVAVHLIVDGVLIYRCWIVYRNSWLTIILPLASLWTADLVAAIAGIVFLVSNHGWPSAQQQNSAIYNYGLSINMAYYLCEIAINVYATSAIVFEIIRATGLDGGPLCKIGFILAESGIVFTITCVLSLCLRVTAMAMNKFSVASLIMNAINFHTAGITFNIILIRVSKEKPQQSEVSQDASKTTILLSTVQFDASRATHETGQSI